MALNLKLSSDCKFGLARNNSNRNCFDEFLPNYNSKLLLAAKFQVCDVIQQDLLDTVKPYHIMLYSRAVTALEVCFKLSPFLNFFDGLFKPATFIIILSFSRL